MTSSRSEGVAISLRGSELIIERRWFDRDYTVPATSRAVLFNGFLGVFFYNTHALFLEPIAGTISPASIVPILLLATGICLAYSVATDWLNRTVIVVTRTTISVRHGPLPWPGNKVVSAAGIKRLHTVMSPWVKSMRRRRLSTFDLFAETADGVRTKIAGGFRQPEAARQAIENYLSIEPVRGMPPDPAELDRQAIDNFFSGQSFEQAHTDAKPRNRTEPPSDLTAVVAFWLLVVLWNGLIWWYILGVASTVETATLWGNIAPITPLALVGLGLIYWAISRTIRFFRQGSKTQRVEN